MVRCPNCGKEVGRPVKSWNYGHFTVKSYLCECGTAFREYDSGGKTRFVLRDSKDKRWVKVEDGGP